MPEIRSCRSPCLSACTKRLPQLGTVNTGQEATQGRFTPGDRALLAALVHRLPRDVLKRLHLVVRPDTVLRWHRDLVARRHAQRSRPGTRAGRAPCARSASWCYGWSARIPGRGYRRVHGELLVLGVKAAASTVWEILHDAGIDPAPERSSTTWTISCAPRPGPCWPVTSSRRSPCPGRRCTCSK